MQRRVMRSVEFEKWLPNESYYKEHLERLTFSFNNIPLLEPGFSAICIGSWGAEAPFLIESLGAKRVVCIRAPGKNVPARETQRIKVPASTRAVEVELVALNGEKEELPGDLKNFDLCLSWEILEHLNYDPPYLFWQSINTIKIGGYLSLTTPNVLWHYYTTAQLFGVNATGLKLQPHMPFATHWRLYSPSEVAELACQMGCETEILTTFLKTEPFSIKSRIFLIVLERFRATSGNGECSIGQHLMLVSRKVREADVWRPTWLFPDTTAGGRESHLEHKKIFVK